MSKYINFHTHNLFFNSENVSEIFNLDLTENLVVPNDTYFSAGLHPWSADVMFTKWFLFMLEKIARHDKCIAVGECGLDYKRNINRELQKEIFEKQLEIAEKFNLPLILHVVAANNDIIAIKKRFNSKVPWIIHGFNSSEIILEQLIENEFYFSVSDVFLKSKSKILSNIPIDRLFLETDNKDIQIECVYDYCSKILKISVEELKDQINRNFESVFKFKI